MARPPDRRAEQGAEEAADHRAGRDVAVRLDAVLVGPALRVLGVALVLGALLPVVRRPLIARRRRGRLGAVVVGRRPRRLAVVVVVLVVGRGRTAIVAALIVALIVPALVVVSALVVAAIVSLVALVVAAALVVGLCGGALQRDRRNGHAQRADRDRGLGDPSRRHDENSLEAGDRVRAPSLNRVKAERRLSVPFRLARVAP